MTQFGEKPGLSQTPKGFALRYLVTGGAGFIGSHVVDALTTRGDSVLVLDDFSTGRRENLEHIVDSDLVELVEGSVLDEELVADCVRSVDACMHLASAVGVQLVVSRPLDSLLRNIRGNDIVISAAAAQDKPLLFASTSEVYGKNSTGALSEDSDRILGSPAKLRWSYATAKAFGEALCYSYFKEQGSQMKVVRLFNTVGPRQTGAYGMVLPRLVRQALEGDDLTVYGNGTQSRCFGHVLDVVHGILLVLDSEKAAGKVFNIGAPDRDADHRAGREGDRAHRLTVQDHARALTRRPTTRASRSSDGASPTRPCSSRPPAGRPTRSIDEAIDDVIGYERGVREPVFATTGLKIAG